VKKKKKKKKEEEEEKRKGNIKREGRIVILTMGRFMKKHHLQEMESVKKPPRRGPATLEMPQTLPMSCQQLYYILHHLWWDKEGTY
jgi:hypothetical protein